MEGTGWFFRQGQFPQALNSSRVEREVSFFTMDVAQRRGGDWRIVELGDAQVAGLPDHADMDGFYKALRDHLPAEPGLSGQEPGS